MIAWWRAFLLVIIVNYNVHVFACDVVDETGNHVRIEKRAMRIISLAPDITEILFAIGAGQAIVGVVSGSDYPEKARDLPVVGSYQGLDLERILALKPDLIITWNQNFLRQLAVLAQQGVPVYRTNPRRLEDIPRTMQKLGCLTGHRFEAERRARQFSRDLSKLAGEYRKAAPVKVFFQLGDRRLMTINRESWINQVITLCGGRNVFAEAAFSAPEVSIESVLAANPVVILNGATDDRWKASWRHWRELAAVDRGNLFTIEQTG